MTSILEKAELFTTHRQGVDQFEAHLTLDKTGETRPSIDRTTEYVMTFKLSVKFWANKAQLSSAAKIAERALLHKIYKDALPLVSCIELAISDGDKARAMDRIAELKAALGLAQ